MIEIETFVEIAATVTARDALVALEAIAAEATLRAAVVHVATALAALAVRVVVATVAVSISTMAEREETLLQIFPCDCFVTSTTMMRAFFAVNVGRWTMRHC